MLYEGAKARMEEEKRGGSSIQQIRIKGTRKGDKKGVVGVY